MGDVRGAYGTLSGVTVTLGELQVIDNVKGVAVPCSFKMKGLKVDLDRVEGSKWTHT